jgi:hypothetical protein
LIDLDNDTTITYQTGVISFHLYEVPNLPKTMYDELLKMLPPEISICSKKKTKNLTLKNVD